MVGTTWHHPVVMLRELAGIPRGEWNLTVTNGLGLRKFWQTRI
jgi:hypothetical protein